MRIGGIASGFDTEQIIKDLMRVERLPLDKVFQQKIRAEWQRDEYRGINTKLARLRDLSFDLQLQGTYNIKQAVSSNESILSVASTGKSQIGSYKIQVNELASSGTFISGKVEDPDVKVTDRLGKFIDELENLEEPASIRLRGSSDSDFVEIQLDAKETVESLVEKINTHKELGINAYYDEHEDRLVLSTKGTGINAKIEFDTTQDEFTEKFFQDVLSGSGLNSNSGTNAQIIINGLVTQRESNTFDLNGTQITLHAKSEQIVGIEVTQDTEKIFDTIKEFIDLYNETIDEINGKLREPFYRDFPPLTDEQKLDMSDREIELWEEKSKSGLLRSDRLLSGVLTNVRTSLTSAVKGLDGISSLHQIGISTGHWSENGKLHINESKLKEAIAENGAEVIKLFTNDPSNSSGEAGIFRRLTSTLGDGVERLAETAGRSSSLYDQSYLSKQIRSYEERMDAMEDRLTRIESRYWAQFTAMEQALQQMYNQSDWLYQQLSALG